MFVGFGYIFPVGIVSGLGTFISRVFLKLIAQKLLTQKLLSVYFVVIFIPLYDSIPTISAGVCKNVVDVNAVPVIISIGTINA